MEFNMDLLIEYVGPALGGAGVLGFLFGLLIRGFFGQHRIRKADVERDVAKTELAQVQEELDALYAAQRKRNAEGAQAVVGDDSLQKELESREDKIKSLTEELTDARDALAAANAASAAAAESAPAAAVSDDGDRAESADNVVALKDRNTWLEERVAVLEQGGGNEASAATPTEAPSGQEEELAKLRWRNRYLEGRLAYFEEGAAGETDAEAPEAAEPESVEAEAEEAEPEAEADHPSDAVLKALENGDAESGASDSIPPLLVENAEGEPDDLTEIGGIGPRIAEVLNGLGVWSYRQIADWTPENAAWIDEQLSFNGRVTRENWIEQAKALI